jgi:transposase
MALKGRRATFAERLSACEAIKQGQSPDLVAQVSGFSRSSVFAWWRIYREQGPMALDTRKTRGPADRLSQQQMVWLYLVLATQGRRTLWTRELVADLIEYELGITLSLVTVSRVLERLGMSPRRPLLDRAYAHDPEKTQRWIETEYPKVRAKAKGGAIFFVDETSIRTDYDADATVVVPGTRLRRSVWMTSAVSPRRELYFTVRQGELNAGDFAAFCGSLAASIDRPLFLIVSNSYVHRGEGLNRLAAHYNATRLSSPPPRAANPSQARGRRPQGAENAAWLARDRLRRPGRPLARLAEEQKDSHRFPADLMVMCLKCADTLGIVR